MRSQLRSLSRAIDGYRPERSFGTVLRDNAGIGPGFDFVRIALALAVLGYHAPEIAYGDQIDTSHARVVWIVRMAILPMFFGLSGFLVAGSAQRLNLKNFIVNRGFRIVPALTVEIMLSAFILGPILTDYSLFAYFNDHRFFTYFANLVGVIHYKLPGLFTQNPFKEIVNGSLWTVPHEILCYVVMSFIIIYGISKNTKALCVVLLAAVTLALMAEYAFSVISYNEIIADVYNRFYKVGLGPVLLPSFLIGAIIFNLRDRVPFDLRIFAGCIFFILALGTIFEEHTWEFLPVAILICPAMIYVVCFLGLTKIPPLPVYSMGDYSYGIYLYGFPIQQSLVHVFPDLRRGLLLFLISLLAATLFAMFSWHFIEKPLLKLRKGFSLVSRFQTQKLDIGEPPSVSERLPSDVKL